jgi:hypothetical protein
LYTNLVAILYVVAYPASDILGRWVDVQNLVDILVVKSFLDYSFDVCEVCYHAILVEFF